MLRYLGVAGGLVALVLAGRIPPAAAARGRGPTAPARTFLASIFAAIGVIVVWLNGYGAWAAMVGGSGLRPASTPSRRNG